MTIEFCNLHSLLELELGGRIHTRTLYTLYLVVYAGTVRTVRTAVTTSSAERGLSVDSYPWTLLSLDLAQVLSI